jgi:MFS transporter, FHS family, glucose/mannose:H+ symporter
VQAPHIPDDTTSGPSVLWLAIGFLLAGLGTVLLGPILPAISRQWHLTDAQSGPLFFAKFVGSFLGGVSVPRRLRFGILGGMALAFLGFGAFGLCGGVVTGSLALFVAGIGLGQIIASTNILAGHRYRAHTGSALASLNFFWSLGAVGTGVLVAALMPRFGLRDLLLCFAAAFVVTGIGGGLDWRVRSQHSTQPSDTLSGEPPISSLPTQALVSFALLLFFYGGLETCLTGWLTTYTLRYSDRQLLGGQSATILMWTALTAGRGLSSIALRYIEESIVQRLGLVLSFLLIGALTMTHHAAALSLCCILIGLSLAPFFPATFGLLMHRGPSPREAGFILAVSGLGAAAFPWLMGLVSTHSGSLRVAMVVPMALALLLLAVSFWNPGNTAPETAALSRR